MSNVFVEIGHGVEIAVKDVVKGAEEVLSVGGKVLKYRLRAEHAGHYGDVGP